MYTLKIVEKSGNVSLAEIGRNVYIDHTETMGGVKGVVSNPDFPDSVHVIYAEDKAYIVYAGKTECVI